MMQVGHLAAIAFVLGIFACDQASMNNKLIGSWRICEYDGNYRELKITKHYSIVFLSDSSISIFENQITNDSIIVQGINVETFNNNREASFIEKVTKDTLVLKSEFGISAFTRLDESIPEVDSADLKEWENSYWQSFSIRKNQFKCPDLRTEEEKKITNLGALEADFEELIDHELPEWAKLKFSNYHVQFERSFQLTRSYLEADFTGDGTDDIAIFVKAKSNNKLGILFLLGETDQTYLIRAGNYFGPGGDDFKTADDWELFTDRVTYETTFLENGDVDDSREVILERPAVSIRESEGSGGLIYYDGNEFIWIHQGD